MTLRRTLNERISSSSCPPMKKCKRQSEICSKCDEGTIRAALAEDIERLINKESWKAKSGV